MKNKYLDAILNEYGFSGLQVLKAPRQFVAETYILKDADDRMYFCKIVDKPMFVPKIVGGLPVLEEMRRRGLTRINYPIRTKGRFICKRRGRIDCSI